MFDYDDEGKRWNALHHPFTAPKDGHEVLLEKDPGNCLSKAYDMVINGWEVGGGSIRIHDQSVQSKVFTALDISCLLYTSPSPRDGLLSRMPSSA